jgi:hypothetical protein
MKLCNPFRGELDLKKIAKINNLISFTMTINSLIAKILKINNCIAEILPDELPESKEFNRNFENGVFIPNLYFHNICVHDANFLHMHINGYHGNRNCSTNDNFCLKIFCPQRHLKIILMSIVVL